MNPTRGLFVALPLAAAVLLSDASPRAQSSTAASPIDVDAITRAAADLPRLHSLLVSWRGSLIFERYFNGRRPAQLANIKSAAKSIVSALVGVALDRGLITDLQQPIGPFFPDLITGSDPVKHRSRSRTCDDDRGRLDEQSHYGAWVQSPTRALRPRSR